ncbi:MAG: flagellin [Phycisphaerae bacterium]
MSRINTNVPSLVAARVLGQQGDSLQTSLERLSTGLRINSGKDDPAGLIASESLRAEGRAIQSAIENSNRASAVVSTAEGALGEVNSLLLELENLVDSAANEAGLSDDEVKANQLQIDSILDTINRISNTTQFNGRKLLDGSLAYSTSGVTSSELASVRIGTAKLPDGGSKSVVVQVTNSAETGTLIFSAAGLAATNAVTLQVAGQYGSDLFSFAGSTSIASIATAINQSKGVTGVSAIASSNNRLYLNSTDFGADAFVSVQVNAGTFATKDTGGNVATQDYGLNPSVTINGTAAETNGLRASVRTSNLSAELILSQTFATQTASTSTFTVTGGGANFAISQTLSLGGRESIGFDSVAASSLGDAVNGYLSSLGSGQANALDSANFAAAQRIVGNAVDQVSSLRGRIGAFQKNTLESTVNSLQVAYENIQAADSAIRDTDFALETSRLTRAQILVQAATQTLGVANQAPSAALSLLR